MMSTSSTSYLLLLLSMLWLATVSTVQAFSSAFVPRTPFLRVQNNNNNGGSSSSSSTLLTMKIFDWKRRTADESRYNNVDNNGGTTSPWNVDTLHAAPGSRKRKTRKGRGIAAGQGATCGFGMRGQKSRGGNPTRPGFEGGQNPLYRALPKFVGKPTGPGHTKTIYNIITTQALSQVTPENNGDDNVVDFARLQQLGLATKSKWTLHKVVSGSRSGTSATAAEVSSLPKLTVRAHAFTSSARAAIEAAGGTCQVLSKTTHTVVEDGTAAANSDDDDDSSEDAPPQNEEE